MLTVMPSAADLSTSPRCDLDPVPHHPAAPEVCVRFKRLHPMAVLPEYKTAGAAGMDLSACLAPVPSAVPSDGAGSAGVGSAARASGAVVIGPGQIRLIPLGFAVAIPPGYEAQVRPRSGLATRWGVTVPNAPGTVDSDYRGEMMVALINLSREPFTVTHGMRIAQMVVAPVARARVVEVDDLEATARGAGGFGSTGH
jgi:dUTP pyrophosphatase